ncbi:ATP-binding cassette domain-containing protein [Teredinibacter purpureus]|uniref:ATP-binding cassette domain-containing protein n=1 Tax=Teredinibacter purpureus TaxID=2731756 RepID=UPI0005F892C1|nr:ATP-binding cassette domain-containing protein [Teredinibacter purpureus]
MIQLQKVSLQLGQKFLLDNTDLTIFPGQKWGVVGANGSGKSTLFKLLLRELAEDAGNIQIPSEWQLAHMAQEILATDRKAIDYIIDGDRPLRKLESDIENSVHDGAKLAQLYQQLEIIDGYTANTRAERLLHGLGFKTEDSQKTVKDFSGGWRIRLNLARALMCRSDLLLLDEPTNHLDLDATLWLEQWLKNYKGTLLIISHDRDFLDNLADSIVHIEHQKLNTYTGNYSSFERQRSERLAQQSAEFEKQQVRIAEIENFVRRFRAKATKAKQAQSRLKELERMEKIAPAHVDSPFSFSFPTPDKLPQTMLTLDRVNIGYESNTIVNNVELSLLASSRIGLLGHNGAGKSSLMKTLAGALPPIAGTIHEGTHLKCGYFAQHQLEALDLHASSALHLQRLTPKASEQEIRNFLGGFGFQGDRAFEVIEHFSGGEKARLALAVLAWQKPNLLLLDEPTNHLDLDMRHALTLALQAWEGGLVIVSHDRHLLRTTVDDFILVDQGKAANFDGTLDDYQQWLLNNDREEPSNEEATHSISSKQEKKELRQQQAAIRQQLTPFTKKLNQLEKKLAKTTKALAEIETQLADPALYAEKNNLLAELLKQQGELKKEEENIETEWMTISEEKENLETTLGL